METIEKGVKYIHCRRFGVFIVKFEHVSHLFVFLLLTLRKYIPAGRLLEVFVTSIF